ncbi:hypothetical protein QZH41_002111 [Actinostola sp. cb2023]|nr:hypothetical protein QZH41_002111 [Actinostola sp. cb2023]
MDIIVNKRCKVEQANNSDIDFEHEQPPTNNEGELYTVEELQNLDHDTVLKIKGCLCLDRSRIEEVLHLGNTLQLLNAASITDNSGSIKISLWDENADLENEKCYYFHYVKIKENHDGTIRLTTTPNTTVELIEDVYPVPEIQIWAELKTLHIAHFEMATNYTTVFLCRNCKKHLTEIKSISTIKCNQCQAMMRVNRCPKIASIKMGVTDEEKVKEILWLTAFEEQLASLLSLALVKERNVIDVVQRSTWLTNAAMSILLVITVTRQDT